MIPLLTASVGIRALGSQMAQRECECFLVRRVADRGIDKNIGGSCVRGIEAFQRRRFAEGGSGDDYLYPRNYRRFADRGNDNSDFIYDSQPVYDEYADEEWYSLFIHGDRNLSGKKLVEGGARLGGDGIGVATVGDLPNLKVPIFQPPNTESLNFELYKVGCKLSMHEAITCGPVRLIEQLNENMAMHMRVVKNLNCDVPQANNPRMSNSNGSMMNTVGKVKLFMEVMMIIMKGNHVDVLFDPGGSFLRIIKTRGRVFFRRMGE